MKILYVTTVSLTLNTFLIPHIKYLIEQGNEVQIASNIDVDISNEFIENNVKHTKIDFSRNPFSISNKRAYKQIKELQAKEKFDIVHVHTPVAAFITRMALRNENVNLIYTAHGFHFYDGAPILNWMLYYPVEKIAARWTDTIVTINNEDFLRASKFKLRNNGYVRRIHGVGISQIPYKLCGFDRLKYRDILGLENNDFVLLILAELNLNKNHIQVIKAMEILRDKYPNIKILCAGKGSLERELSKIIKKKKCDDNIKLIGFRNDIRELIEVSDCIGLFSKREGLGKCLLEGMINKKPLIATNTRGARELIRDKKNGFLVEIGDYRSTALAIEKLYLSNKSITEFAKEENEVKKYLMENVLNEISDIYLPYNDDNYLKINKKLA